MTEEAVPGRFVLSEVDGPAGLALCNWHLVNTKGDVIAESVASTSETTARETIRWIIDNAAAFDPPEDRGFRRLGNGS